MSRGERATLLRSIRDSQEPEKFFKKISKPLDKPHEMWYNQYVPKR